jgi:hypothetical protein
MRDRNGADKAHEIMDNQRRCLTMRISHVRLQAESNGNAAKLKGGQLGSAWSLQDLQMPETSVGGVLGPSDGGCVRKRKKVIGYLL